MAHLSVFRWAGNCDSSWEWIAEVWQVDANGNKTKLGDDTTCTDLGSMFALTELANGTRRLAAGCEFQGSGDAGIVQILDWDGSAWVNVTGSPLAVDLAGTTAGLFGFDMAWENLGTRLAISAPNYMLVEKGLVRMYDYDGTSAWTQLGADLKGSQVSEKSGFPMGMSSDCETLVIGSPNKYSTVVGNETQATGAVQIYTLNGITWQFVEEIVGEGTDDRCGRGISVKSDGTLFCAFSAYHNLNHGQVRVLELSGSSWTTIGEFEGDNEGDLLGFNNMAVTLTDDGTRIAMASIHAQTNGIVQVFDGSVIAAPSQAPSGVIQDNNMNIGTFDWDIERVGDVEIVFSEEADASEIKLHYNISLRETKIEALEADCSTPIPPNVTTLTSSIIPTSSSYGNFTVTDYPGVLTDVATGEGLISIYIRVDLTLGDAANTSVSFHEQKLFVSVGLLQGFEVTGSDLTRLNATEEAGAADFDFNVTACHCDDVGSCINTVLTQGSNVRLCVRTNAPNVEFVDIRELTMAQGAFNTTPIVAGVKDSLTEVTINGKEASIQYQIISAFFSDPNPLDIEASGAALLAFTDDNGRRLLRSAKVVNELDQEEKGEDRFRVSLPAESALLDSSGAACGMAGGFAPMGAIVIGGVAGAMIL